MRTRSNLDGGAATGAKDCRLRLVTGLFSGRFRDQPKTRPRAVCDAGESLHQHSRPGKNTGLLNLLFKGNPFTKMDCRTY